MATERNLVFMDTMSLNDFKERVAQSSELDVLDNGNGLFFQARAERGAVASSFDEKKEIVISRVHEPEKEGQAFWLMHNKQTDKVQYTL